MTFALGIDASLRALTAARLGIQTASQNVANVNTPGYSRQRLTLSASQPVFAQGFQIGSGVQVGDIRRIVDEGLLTRLTSQQSLTGHSQARYERLLEIESLFGADGGGLGTNLNGLFSSLGQLQSDPGDRALRGGVVQAAQAFTSGLNLIAGGLGGVGETVYGEVRGLARTVEAKAGQVAALNEEIVRTEVSGAVANDLRDQRELLIRQIAEVVDVRQTERSSGAVDLVVGGRLLVAGGRASSVQVTREAGGQTRIGIGGRDSRAEIEGGRIGALLEFERASGPGYRAELDAFVRDFTLAFDRLHTTGTPADGPFQTLVSQRGARDTNGNGQLGDELLGSLGVPFDVQNGELFVRVVDRNTGGSVRHRVAIDPNTTTLQDLASQLNAIPNLSSSVDASGRLQISATQGYGFDFSPTLESDPDPLDVFGSAHPTVSTAGDGPYDLGGASFPLTFTVDADGLSQVVTLEASDFANSSMATAEELAAAINADVTNARAQAIDGRLVVQGNSTGAAATLTLAEGAGSPLAALGLTAGTFAGQDQGVSVSISGSYSGLQNTDLSFVPRADGEIGVTPGLLIDVYDQNNQLVGSLDVGSGYQGEALNVLDGIQVSFGQGSVSATANDRFSVDAVADPDSSDILVALGMNTFFVGDATAQTVEVNPDIIADPRLLAASRDGGSGGGGNLLAFDVLAQQRRGALGNADFEDFVGDLIADVGFETARARSTFETQQDIAISLEQQRLSISGVDLDEELLDLTAYQQAFEAASRLVAVAQEMTDTLINLGSSR